MTQKNKNSGKEVTRHINENAKVKCETMIIRLNPEYQSGSCLLPTAKDQTLLMLMLMTMMTTVRN